MVVFQKGDFDFENGDFLSARSKLDLTKTVFSSIGGTVAHSTDFGSFVQGRLLVDELYHDPHPLSEVCMYTRIQGLATRFTCVRLHDLDFNMGSGCSRKILQRLTVVSPALRRKRFDN